jgi:hypothetical protein
MALKLLFYRVGDFRRFYRKLQKFTENSENLGEFPFFGDFAEMSGTLQNFT